MAYRPDKRDDRKQALTIFRPGELWREVYDSQVRRRGKARLKPVRVLR